MDMEADAIPNKSNLTRFKLAHELFVPKRLTSSQGRESVANEGAGVGCLGPDQGWLTIFWYGPYLQRAQIGVGLGLGSMEPNCNPAVCSG